MTDIDKGLIKALVEAWGPSGYEHDVRALIRGYVAELADDGAISVDPTGALVVRLGSATNDGKKIMIAAHMDEIGLFVHHIDRDGYARFSSNGGLMVLSLWGRRVRFANGAVGVIGLDNPYSPTKIPTIQDFYIDFGTGAGAYAPVSVGDVGALIEPYHAQGDRLIAKSLDDRVGCAVLIETMRALRGHTLTNEVYFVFTTQEEIGIRGARGSAFAIDPDYAIAVDVTSAGDQPKMEKVAAVLGGGAAIKARDSGHVVPPWIKDLMIQRATDAHIPYQIEILDMGTTDAAGIQLTRAGIPSGTISIPCRYVHTVSETVDVHDVAACVALLVELVSKPFGPDAIG